MIDFILGLSPGLLIASLIIAFIALVSQMALYAKAGQPPVAALVPVWNVMVFCKVVGRPVSHSWFLIAPGIVMAAAVGIYWDVINGLFPVHTSDGGIAPGPSSFSDATVPFIIMGVAAIPLIWIVIQMFIEVCDSFGKHKTIDKVLCVTFNGAYILFVLGISDAEYESPWWRRKRGLPYYVPDFKHKGKKFYVKPEGPVEGDDYQSQKLNVQIIDKKEDPIRKGTEVTSESVRVESGGGLKGKVAKQMNVNAKEAAKKEEGSDTSSAKQTTQPEEKSESKEATKGVSKKDKAEKSAEKKDDNLNKKPSKKDEQSEGGGALSETKKKFSKKESDDKSSDSSGKSWRDEMLEKYSKKK